MTGMTRRRLLARGTALTGGLAAAGLVGNSLVGSGAGIGRAFAAGEPEVGDNGLHIQPWFNQSFLELGEDHAEAAGADKDLAVIFEQRGCPYCREMHRVNFAKPEIADYVKANFLVDQLDMWGSREVTDFDGEAMEERALARRWGVVYTPTIVFFSREAKVAGKSGKDTETSRMPGYFKPFHFLTMFEYVHEGHWKDMHFQKYIQAKVEKRRERGAATPVWE